VPELKIRPRRALSKIIILLWKEQKAMTENVLLECIKDNPYQPRTADNVEHIKNLALSIAADGLLQVPKARHTLEGAELAFGHSRRKAFEWLKANWEKTGLRERYNNYTEMPLNFEELSNEDMYRQAVSENVQRKDLDPIELAKAMVVYRDQFGKNSDEIGELFGMNGATVRGKLRLLDLPEQAKKELSEGLISEGTARDILSLQKVTTEAVVLDVIEKIKAGVDRWGNETTPREVIADVIEDMDSIVQMTWNTGDGKKPTVKNNGWALDMKKFPNQYLPLLTGHVAVQALNCFNDKPAQKLVLEIAEYLSADLAEDVDDEYHQANANQIQKRMEALAEINPEYRQRLEHLITPPSCNVCPFMTKFDDHYFCGIKECFERKFSAWKKHEMHTNAKTLGVELYDRERDGEFLVLEDTYRNNAHADLWKKKSKDLRIAFMADIDRKKYQSGYSGCPDGCVVIVVGKTLEKLLIEKEQKREEKQVDMEEVREEMMDKRIDELVWEATAYLKSVLDGVSDAAVMSLYDAPRYGWSSHPAIPENDFSGNEKMQVMAEHTRREVAFWMLLGGEDGIEIGVDAHETLADLVVDIQKRAKEWKVKIPAEFAKKAAQYDAEIAEAVSTETKNKKKKK
jgi:ParB/RepB/Spo0J family partition protein